MKIAVATNGSQVSGHFGHSESFTIYDIENGKISSQSTVPNPGHKPGFLPNFLGDMGVEVIIVGGMGASAAEIFRQRNIETILGAQGDATTAVETYLRGELHSNDAFCMEHHHHHHSEDCGNH